LLAPDIEPNLESTSNNFPPLSSSTPNSQHPSMQRRPMDDTDDPSGLSQYTLYETKV
jgi:hypothetical protein